MAAWQFDLYFVARRAPSSDLEFSREGGGDIAAFNGLQRAKRSCFLFGAALTDVIRLAGIRS